MDKCKWEDGVFVGCENLKDSCSYGIILGSNAETEWESDYELFIIVNSRYRYIHFCPYCGADIRKPETLPCNDWKQLEIGNLPPDILLGGYEMAFEDKQIGVIVPYYKRSIIDILHFLTDGISTFYRKSADIPPENEED